MTRSGRPARLARIAAAGIMVTMFAAFGMFSIIPSLRPLNLVQNSLPADAKSTCVVTPAVFATWFHSGNATLDGLVDPANSVTFPDIPNCSFYQWSEQMFLWITSPTNGQRVFNTSTFFDVSAPDPNNGGARSFIPHPLNPALIDVEQGQADGSVLEAQATSGGSLVYYITMVNDVYAFLATGVKINPPLNPAPTHFPTTQSDLNQITTFAAQHGVTFPDPNALAIMVKSSWVLAAGLPNLSTYITTTATVPTYDQSNPAQWVLNGQQTVQLALVGMHVVGSTGGLVHQDGSVGHPEMIWATFEHFANAPRGEYRYVNTNNNNNIVTVDEDPTASWVFTSTNSAGPFNCLHMTYNNVINNPPSIKAFSPTIPPSCPANAVVSPSDTIRWKAFGAASEVVSNPIDVTPRDSNTEIISINNSIIGMLQFMSGTDVRSNYVMTGATWTVNGAAPTGIFANGGNEVGTNVLSNATMETYNQGTDNTLASGGLNCFTCHNTDGLNVTMNGLNVSHDFGDLLPLTSFSPNPGYTLGSFPANLFMEKGAFASTQISVIPQNGFKGNIKLSAAGIPEGVKATFNPKYTSTTSTLTLTSTSKTPAGVSTVQILGSSGTLTSSTMVSLTVNAPSFGVAASPNELTINQNSSGTSTITIYPVDGFSGDVTLVASNATNLPRGVSATFSPNPATSTSTLTLTASPKAPPGSVTITIRGTSGTLKSSTTLALTVVAAQ